MNRISKGIILAVLASVVLLGLLGCASTNQANPVNTYESVYELVGYRYVYKAEGETLTFNYIDYLSNKEVKGIAENMSKLLPKVVSYEVTVPGQLTFTLKSVLSEEKFNAFVEENNKAIYSTFYK